jgi:muramoyltetrapeptide carboxypeptidase
MMINRRKFITLATASALLGGGVLKAFNKQLQAPDSSSIQNSKFKIQNSSKEPQGEFNLIKPNALRKGSVMAFTAPASSVTVWELHNAMQFFEKMGCKIILGDTVKKRQAKYKYFSASDEDRAKEFMSFIEDKKVNAILCARGGFGSMRILPSLDFNIIRENPKIIAGFSDNTILINSILVMSRLVTFHSAIASSFFNTSGYPLVKEILFSKEKFTPIKITHPYVQTMTGGTVEGKIVGGNLSMLASSLGTPYEINTKGTILLIEDTMEEPYQIDKMLSQLWLAGKLQDCAGVVVGFMKNLDTKTHFFPDLSFTIREVIESRVKSLGKPAIIGLPYGHVENKIMLPLGVRAELNADKKTLTLLEPAVTF